jgi:trimeric autotransporter adhesin
MIIDSGIVTGSLLVQGPLTVSGSLSVTDGITGSLQGTASYATSALTASYAANVPLTASYALTALTASYASNIPLTASYALQALTASYWSGSITNAATASYVLNAVSSSFSTNAQNAQTASYVLNAVSSSYATNALNAQTASYANNLTVGGTLTVQTIVAQTITSSINFVTGSTRFGSNTSNTHQFTGSILASGSLTISGSTNIVGVSGTTLLSSNADTLAFTGSLLTSGSIISTGSLSILGGITGSLLGSASYATNALSASYWSGSIQNVNSASYALTASYAVNATSASYALTASNSNNSTSASYALTASYAINATSSSYAETASNAPNYLPLAGGTMTGDIYAAGRSFTFQDLLLGAGTTFGKITTDGSKYISVMPTYNVESARFWPNGNVTIQDAGNYVDNGFRLDVSGSGRFTDGLTVTGSLNVANGITGSLFGTSSYAVNASSSSFATSASYWSGSIQNAESASYALTASYASNVPVTASYALTANTASYALTASYISGSGAGVGFPFSGSAIITGSLFVSSSFISGSFVGDGAGITGLTAGGKIHTQSTAASTWTFVHNLGVQYPNVTVYNNLNEIILPQTITATDSNTLVLTFGSTVAGYAIAGIGGIINVQGRTTQQYFTTATTWSFAHNLGDKYVSIQAFDDAFEMMIPSTIRLVDATSSLLLFESASCRLRSSNYWW